MFFICFLFLQGACSRFPMYHCRHTHRPLTERKQTINIVRLWEWDYKQILREKRLPETRSLPVRFQRDWRELGRTATTNIYGSWTNDFGGR